jgi:hypothetical protein
VPANASGPKNARLSAIHRQKSAKNRVNKPKNDAFAGQSASLLHYGNNGAKTSVYVKISATEMAVFKTSGLEAIGKHRQTKRPGKIPGLLSFDSKNLPLHLQGGRKGRHEIVAEIVGDIGAMRNAVLVKNDTS